eukprot:SAG31_NODE_37254_length_306_cov_0.497585_1_plen_47_part_10
MLVREGVPGSQDKGQPQTDVEEVDTGPGRTYRVIAKALVKDGFSLDS